MQDLIILMYDAYSTTDRLAVSDILGNPHRNHVLHVLRCHGTPMTLETLAMHVDRSNATDPFPGSATGVEPVSMVKLHHTHLPKLDDVGVIRYDSYEQTVVSVNDERLDSLVELGQQMLESLRYDRPRTD
ncbi:DUF7344 domain-containing protein [Haloferax marinisediminis]|uniref:DUF7344 domain-containing protein n=1 Tax=Haloferax marinisediminis TaxID=2666142 RepID=UPI0018A1FCBF|nr:hypothetical protein [Haloferax marinisediminis]